MGHRAAAPRALHGGEGGPTQALYFPKGWVLGSPAPGPRESPALWLCRSQGLWLESQPGRLSFLCLSTFGEGISSCPGLRVRFPPRWKVPPRGPQRRAHHGDSIGRPPDTGARATAGPRGKGLGRPPVLPAEERGGDRTMFTHASRAKMGYVCWGVRLGRP